MRKLNTDKRAAILNCLVEGNSLRATSRMTGAALNTVTKLLVDAGDACSEYQDKTLRGLKLKRVQVDEIWSFVHTKAKNLRPEKRGVFGVGDVWTWTAICADTKLVPSWLVGPRDLQTAIEFMHDLQSRLANRVQLTSDGAIVYVNAVEEAFGTEVDFAQLVKLYGTDPQAETRYSPAECIGTRAWPVTGDPDPKHVSTSFVERQNLTMRMGMRRFTRLTNGFSKKVENHAAAISLHFMHYNFARIHKTLRVTPAQEAGVTTKLWSIADIAALVP